MLSPSEIKSLRDGLRKAHEIVKEAFSATRAAGISSIARDLRHIGNSIDDAIADLCEMKAKLDEQASQGGPA